MWIDVKVVVGYAGSITQSLVKTRSCLWSRICRFSGQSSRPCASTRRGFLIVSFSVKLYLSFRLVKDERRVSCECLRRCSHEFLANVYFDEFMVCQMSRQCFVEWRQSSANTMRRIANIVESQKDNSRLQLALIHWISKWNTWNKRQAIDKSSAEVSHWPPNVTFTWRIEDRNKKVRIWDEDTRKQHHVVNENDNGLDLA